MKRFLVRYPFMVPLIGIILGAIIAFVLSMAPGFVKSAYACGGWWDPCCPWWEPQRCEAFNANKKKVTEENAAYLQRWEDRLEAVSENIGLLPGPGLASWAIAQAKKGIKNAKEANLAAARGVPSSEPADYDETPYEWVNKLGEDSAWLLAYGNYAAGQVHEFSSCMQAGGESGCQGYKDNANWGLWYLGDWHGEMGWTMDVVAYQLEYWYGGGNPAADGALILREAANRFRYTEEVLQQ